MSVVYVGFSCDVLTYRMNTFNSKMWRSICLCPYSRACTVINLMGLPGAGPYIGIRSASGWTLSLPSALGDRLVGGPEPSGWAGGITHVG